MSFRLFYILLIFTTVRYGEGVWAWEEGLTSYYHHHLHGRKSSSGRAHDKGELVAVHRTYSLGTFLRVTNLEDMRSVIVCVTDREPRYRKRIADISANAAGILGSIDKGVVKVRIEVVLGPLDLRYLDSTYPKILCLDIDYLHPDPPYRMKFAK